MPETTTPAEPRERMHGTLFHALISVNVEPELAHDASEEVRNRAGENIVAEIKASEERTNARFNVQAAEIKAMEARTNARIDIVVSSIQSLQREVSTNRWTIGLGFAVLALLITLFQLFRS